MGATELRDALEKMLEVLIACATTQNCDGEEYKRLRARLLNSPLRARLPNFIRSCFSLSDFWDHVKVEMQLPTYASRRKYLKEAFVPLLLELEEVTGPGEQVVTTTLSRVDAGHVREQWERALARRESDPEGAITMARTLLESVCKYVLDSEKVSYDAKADLPALYREAATLLQLAPDQYGEKEFKRILGAATTVVEGLGALRNRLGDAHGQGRRPVRPSARHAGLAVALAGGTASFLIETYEARVRPVSESSPPAASSAS